MFSIKEDLVRSLRKYCLNNEMEAFLVCRKGEKIILGFCKTPQSAPKVVKYLKQTQVLEVKIREFATGHLIRSKQREIIKTINQSLGGEYVRKIRYRIN